MQRVKLAAIVVFALVAAPLFAAGAPQQPAKATELKLAPGQTAIYISNMHCPTCAKKIAGKLYRVKGVVKVKTDVKKNLAVITPQSKKIVDSKAAWNAVRSAGFKPTKLIGPQGTFVADKKTKDPVKVAKKPATPPAAG
ncbi:MAG TPA: cation transporter [Lacipirellula sp.]